MPVDPDHRLLAGVDPRLGAGGGLFDPALGQARLDRPGHTAQSLDLGDVDPRPRLQVVGQALHQERAAPGIHRGGDAALQLQQQLRVAGDAGGEIRRQSNGFVERVGVERLRPAKHSGHGLDGRAGDVVEHVLGRQAPSRGLAVAAEHLRALILG